MLGRLFRKSPYTPKRYVALTSDFLTKHKQKVSGRAFANHILTNVEAGGEDAALRGFGPNAQAQLGYYPVYAVHLARYALAFCSALMSDPIDADRGFAYAGLAVHRGLDTDPETAGQVILHTLEDMPRKEDGTEFTGDEVDALPEKARRLVLIEEIARSDAQIVLEAFGDGAGTVDLSDCDVEPLAALLELSVIPDPDHERLAAEIKRRQG